VTGFGSINGAASLNRIAFNTQMIELLIDKGLSIILKPEIPNVILVQRKDGKCLPIGMRMLGPICVSSAGIYLSFSQR
jgi:hypothetical protein